MFLGNHEKHEIHERVKVGLPCGPGSFFSCKELAVILIISFSEAIASVIFGQRDSASRAATQHTARRKKSRRKFFLRKILPRNSLRVAERDGRRRAFHFSTWVTRRVSEGNRLTSLAYASGYKICVLS